MCGRREADILCAKCGGIICDNCYDEEADSCIVCSGKKPSSSSGLNRPAFFVVGLMLILLGLMITSWAFIPQDGVVFMLFPFMFSGFNSTSALLMSLVFFAVFSLSSLLPLYMLFKRSEYMVWEDEIYNIKDSVVTRGNTTESIEYMITTEIPGSLKDTIYMEEEEHSISLMSSKDANFLKKYTLPSEYRVEEVESEFEGSFLVVRVYLKKDL